MRSTLDADFRLLLSVKALQQRWGGSCSFKGKQFHRAFLGHIYSGFCLSRFHTSQLQLLGTWTLRLKLLLPAERKVPIWNITLLMGKKSVPRISLHLWHGIWERLATPNERSKTFHWARLWISYSWKITETPCYKSALHHTQKQVYYYQKVRIFRYLHAGRSQLENPLL